MPTRSTASRAWARSSARAAAASVGASRRCPVASRMSTPSPLDEGLTPERLTEVLRGSGALDGGRVVEVAVETSRTTLISTIDRLRLRYAGGGGPATLIRKEPRQDIAPDLASLLGREVAFYTQV